MINGIIMRRIQSMVLSKNRYFIIGVTIGVILSLFVMPFLEDCHNSRIDSENNWYSLIVNNDYNPVIRLKPKNYSETYYERKDDRRHDKVLVRPRFYTTELEVKENLLICVLLSNDKIGYTLNNQLFNKTIQQFSDKVLFFYEDFMSGSENQKNHKLSQTNPILISEENIESIEVPFLKSKPKYLKILNYLFKTKTVHNFNFVFIISDKTYVNGNNLYKFLSNFTVSQYIFASPLITQNDNDFDVNSNPNDLLESGVIFSCSLLLKCNLDIRCLNEYKNKYPNPTQSTFISYELDKNQDFLLNYHLFYKSLTTYPVTDINTHYKLHLIWCQNAIIDSLEELKVIENQIIDNNNQLINGWPAGVQHSHKPTNRFEVIRWLYYNESHSLMPNDFDVTKPLTSDEKVELTQIKSECIEWLREKYKNLINEDKIKIINFYKKFDAIRGLEYMVDFRVGAFADMKRLQLIKPLNKIELIPGVPYVTENVRIVMILPIRSDDEIESTSSFLNQYTNVCLKKSNHQTVLILILINQFNHENHENHENQYNVLKEHASQLQNKYKNSGAKIAWIPINSAKDEKVPTELAYYDILSKKLSISFSDALILNCRANMIISLDFLNRVRLNTIQGNQVFFPIPFVEYRLRSQVKPLKNFDVRKDNGYFDSTDYNHGSFYLSDYLKARKESQHLLPIVKNEQYLKRSIYYDSEIDLFHLFIEYNSVVKRAQLKTMFIMRAIEPELKLKHQSFTYDCFYYESNKFAIENCQKRNLIGLGSKRQLAALIIDDNRKDGLEVNEQDNNAF